MAHEISTIVEGETEPTTAAVNSLSSQTALCDVVAHERGSSVSNAASESTRVEARPAAWCWWIAAPFLALGGLASWVFLADAGQEPQLWWLAFAVLAFPSLLAGALTAWWGLRSRIVADEDGLRWRSFGAWRRARWDEVTDFHHRPNPNGPVNWSEVETRSGRLAFGGDRKNAQALRAVIGERAVAARARYWGEKGLRAEDPWPRTFGYDLRRDLQFLWTVGGLGTLGSVLLAASSSGGLPTSVADIDWPLAIGEWLVKVGFVVSLLVVTLLAFLPSIRDTRRRRDERISVNLNGIRFQGKGHEVAASWDEVTNYFTGPANGWVKHGSPSVVVTRNGTFRFTQALERGAQLREIIRLHAGTEAKGWFEDSTAERLGGEELCWTGQTSGVGQRVFHFRTRTNRVGIAYLGAVSFAFAISALIGPLAESVGGERFFAFTVGGSLIAAFLWSIWRYRSAAILVDEYGLTQRAWNGDRFLRWEEIEELSGGGLDSMDLATVKAKGRRIRFWLSVADAAELKDEIARRAVNATGGWEN